MNSVFILMNMFFPDKSRKIKLVTYLMFGKKANKNNNNKRTQKQMSNFCELVSKRVVLGYRNFLLNFR